MFKNLKIAKKLIISFIATVLIASIGGIVGLAILSSVDKGYSDALVTNGFVLGDIGDFNAYLNRGGAMVRDIIMLTDPADIKSAQAELEDAVAKCSAALERARVLCSSPEELAILSKIDIARPKYADGRDRAVKLGLANSNDEALRVFREDARPYLNECIAAGEELMALNVSMGNTVSSNLTKQSNMGMLAIVIVILTSTIISIVLAIVVSSSISKPVKACAQRLALLSEGDLHTEVPAATSTDETGVMLNSLKTTTDFMNEIIGDISRALSQMADGDLTVSSTADFKGDFVAIRESIKSILISLNDTLGQINQASEQVSSGSDQVSSGAQALSQGATEQASAVEELAATITEISAQVKANAENAQEANTKASKAGTEVEQSNREMQELIAAMEDISNS